jgi:ATP/maltotriose-dependent transcriptional regulator MalT/DNA-binding SARP family transcriptional activator
MLVAGPGYGKTLAVEEAIELAELGAVWLPCGDSGGEGGRLLVALLDGLRAAVPGAADVVGESLSATLEPVDVGSATTALLAELKRLLVEPLAVVFDDAERIEADEEALALLQRLLEARGVPLAIAVASRRPLPLKLAKLRASGKLTEIGPAELSFSAAECEEVLRLRHGREPSEAEIGAVLASSEGWPMGVALSGLTGAVEAGETPLPREDLFGYLAEEVFDGLDADTRLHLADASVPDLLSDELAGELGLPAGFLEEAERRGLFLRTLPSGARSFHPLFRDFLRRRQEELRDEGERARLQARAAAALAAAGRPAEAIAHWLAAAEAEQALAHLSGAGAGLLRTSPGAVAGWLEAMPEELRDSPEYLLLEAQLLWGSGGHERAVEPLRRAAAAFEAADDHDRAWIARFFHADTLVFTGAFTEVSAVAAGWEDAEGPIAATAAMAVAWFEVVALFSLGRREQAAALRERLLADPAAGQFELLDVIASSGTALVAGETQPALALLRAMIAQLELQDPFGRLPYAMGMVLVILRNLGEHEQALEWVKACEREAERVGLGFAARDFRLQRATLFAQLGDLGAAEAALAAAAATQLEIWRDVFQFEAEAHVALLRGDAAAAIEAARKALAAGAAAPLPWRGLATVEMAVVLAEAGALDAAAEGIEATLATLAERFAGPPGSLHRSWCLAARACLEQRRGDEEAACASLAAAWEEAGEERGRLLRAQWPRVRPALSAALASGAIDPEAVLTGLREAFPRGEALAALADNAEPSVRRAALLAALASDHPSALSRLAELEADEDAEVAAAAGATAARLRGEPPPLRFELLGGFRLRRAGWELDEAAWQRPMAARVVRFLLIQGAVAVPEDALFEAFWADRDADAARQHLAVAVSRARKVLDLPGAEQSAIEVRERTYRLRLRERDTVDAVQFEAAASAALAEQGAGRRAALERAAELWGGDPLPEDRYEAWAAPWRERLVHAYVEVLGALIEGQAGAGELDQQIRTARRLLAVEPVNEAAHRSLMLAYGRSGRTSHALRQYLECRHALVVELGVEPAAETNRLQARILAGEPL